MNKVILTLTILAFPVLLSAQFSSILKKTQDKVNAKANSRIDQKIDKTIDDTFDKVEGKEPAKDDPSPPQKPQAAPNPAKEEKAVVATNPTAAPVVTSFAKYDFIPGEKIIYSNDFSAESMGELPTGWNSSGNGAVVRLTGIEGNWVQFYKNAVYLTDNKNDFTENFTLEFDLLIRRSNPKESFPQLGFGFLSAGKDSTTHNKTLKEYKKYFAAELKLQPSDYNGSHMHYESFENYNVYLQTEVKKHPALESYFNIPIHIAMQRQKERLRIWINETKMYDLPRAVKADVNINQLFFFVKGNGGNDDEVGYNVSNIKIATGLPDTRHRLIEEGKFSTTGILFAVNSAEIKPESNGVLKEISGILSSNPAIRIRIIGHTDSDGSDASNLELSKKRANAVKQKLVTDFAIAADRIECDGKGETMPVSDNKTKEGKAENRRVEFVKL